MLEKTLESPLDCKEIQPVHPKGNQSWIFIGRTDTEAETPILWTLMWRTDSFEKTLMLGKIEVGGEADDRGWDGWMASLTQWTWVWVNSGRWWRTGKSGMLQSMGSQRVGNDWATDLIWSDVLMVLDLWAVFSFCWNSTSILASLTQWTWVWASSRSCWWAGKPGMLQFMLQRVWSQRVGPNWATELREL